MPMSLKRIKNNLLVEYITELEQMVEDLASKLTAANQPGGEQPDDLAERLGVKGVIQRKH